MEIALEDRSSPTANAGLDLSGARGGEIRGETEGTEAEAAARSSRRFPGAILLVALMVAVFGDLVLVWRNAPVSRLYILLPLLLATTALAAQELARRRAGLSTVRTWFDRWAAPVAPPLLSTGVFLCGAVLLVSGAAPRAVVRMSFLARALPLSMIEVSHFLASVIGLALLLLAHALYRRLDAAYHLTIALLAGGAVFSLLKGLDFEEALVLLTVLAALLPCRRHFYRQARILAEPFTPGWVIAVCLVLAGSTVLGLFAGRHVPYGNDLWLRFDLFDDVSRFFRATLGVTAGILLFAGARLLSPARPRAIVPEQPDVESAGRIVAVSPRASSHLALLGDKSFLFTEDRRAMIMYAASGRSCIAMGDPIGAADRYPELVWRFRELCDRRDAYPVFYQAAAEMIPHYLDVGLYPFKLGECARVALSSFSLEGHARKDQRYIVRRLERDGVSFEVLPPERVAELLGELRDISNQWLTSKNTREKRFSLGLFDPAYVCRSPLAVARQANRIVAFATLWCGAEREELAVDLMRYRNGAPPSVMEYLLLRLMLWGKDEGYRWFNLGMAPLSGIDGRSLAPLWHRVGAFAFRHGERFYNLQGVRLFKQKFDPLWEPRYLVCPDGLAVARVLADVAALVSGGLKGMVSK